jgi:hypothetical protein
VFYEKPFVKFAGLSPHSTSFAGTFTIRRPMSLALVAKAVTSFDWRDAAHGACLPQDCI